MRSPTDRVGAPADTATPDPDRRRFSRTWDARPAAPRRSPTDADDMFLAGLTATVEAVMRDVEDHDCLAVTIDDDPAKELFRWQRRLHYFAPDEIELLDVSETSGAA